MATTVPAATGPIQLFYEDPAQIVADMTAYYQTLVGKTLQPAQIEQLLINAFAYRESLLNSKGDNAVNQMLVDFSAYPALDFLGALLNVTRLAPQAATCLCLFTIVPGNAALVIPAGTQVASNDGAAIFQTQADTPIVINQGTIAIEMACTVPGSFANGYGIGAVSTILDPQPYLQSVSNTQATGGGSDQETDDQLRTRIKLAPSQFSNAGSVDAYKFWTLSASSEIVDAGVMSLAPGTVNVYPLVQGGGVTPPQIIQAVQTILSSSSVRPLTDTVVVASPITINYSVTLVLTLYSSADPIATQTAVTTAVQNFTSAQGQTMGGSISITQLIALAMIPGSVFDCTPLSPTANVIAADNQIAVCSGITVTINPTTVANGS